MNCSRRIFVKMACAGAAVAAAQRPSWAADGASAGGVSLAPAESLLLHVDAAAPTSFLDAAGRARSATAFASSRVVLTEGGQLDLVAGSIDWLAERPGHRLIGLVRDADAVAFQQLARDRGLRWLSIAHHGQGGGATFGSRHQITSLESNRGLGGLLAAELAASESSFLVVESPAGSEAAAIATAIPANGAAPRGWEAALAEALTLIAAGRWPEQSLGQARIYSGRGSPAASAGIPLTSFVIAS